MKREIVELREVVQKLVPLLTGKGLEVTQRGSQAYVRTDPQTRKPLQVNIPNISDNASDSFIRAVSGFIDHEVAHVLITDWFYYAGGPTPQELKRPEVQKLMNCHNIIEDTMIEREIVKIFPGSKKNIADLREHFIRKITKPAMEKAKNEQEQFNYLLVPVMRALAGHTEFQEYMDENDYWSLPMIKQLVEAFDAKSLEDLKTVETTQQTLVIAKELYNILYNKPKPPQAPPAPSDCSDPSEGDADGESQDKPDQKAGEGDGDGERDHSDQEDGEQGEGDDDGKAGGDQQEEETEDDGDKSDGETAEEDDAGDTPDTGDTEGDDEKDAGDGGDDAGEDADDGAEDGEDGGGGSDTDDGDGSDDDAAGDDGAEGEESGDDEDGGSDTGDDADESDDPDDGSAGSGSDEDADGGDADADGGDEGDDSADTGKSGKGSAEPGVDDGDDKDGGGGSSDPVEVKSDGGRDESDRHAPKDSDDESEGGSGVGSEEAKSMFEFEEDALEGRGIAEEMMVLISDEAVDSISQSDWSVFSREWDIVAPLEVPEKINSKWVPDMEEEVRAMTGRMQKDIERIMASQSHVVNTPGHKRGRLHAASLYRVSQGDPRVFTQKQEHKSKDTAVMLLADNSGSMSGAKMKAAMTATYALSATLDRVNIAHEMMGFTTGGWNMSDTMYEAIRQEHDKSGIDYDRVIPLIMPIYKSFEERLDATVKRRVAYAMNAQRGLNGNIDGESLMIAAERLARRTEKRKVMLVLSDGQPAGGRKSGSHLKGTVEYLNDNGIETIGIGIMSRAVEHYYDNHVVLNHVDDLPGQVMSEIKRLLG